MNAVLASGARIAAERVVGWNRQLRLTPLTSRAYFRDKVLTGVPDGARHDRCCCTRPGRRSACACSAQRWIEMTVLILVGLIPFAALGIIIGHLVSIDSIGPVDGRHDGAARAARRRLVPDLERRRAARHRAGRCRRTGSSRRATSRSAAVPGAPRAGSCGAWSAARAPRRLGVPARHDSELREGRGAGTPRPLCERQLLAPLLLANLVARRPVPVLLVVALLGRRAAGRGRHAHRRGAGTGRASSVTVICTHCRFEFVLWQIVTLGGGVVETHWWPDSLAVAVSKSRPSSASR